MAEEEIKQLQNKKVYQSTETGRIKKEEYTALWRLMRRTYGDMILNKIPNNRCEILNNQYETEQENSHPLSIVMKTLMNSQAQWSMSL